MKAAYPRVQFHRQRGVVSAIFGTALARGGSPQASADAFLQQWPGAFATELGELRPQLAAGGELLSPVRTDGATGRPRFYTFRYQQYFRGWPVFRAGIGFLVRNDADFPLVLTGLQLKEMAAAVGAARAEPQVTAAMRAQVVALLQANSLPTARREVTEKDLEFAGQQLTWWAGVPGQPVDVPEPALEFVAQFGSVQTFPDYQKMHVVASLATGAILWSESKIHFTDIHGTVSGRATDGPRAAECDPEAAFRLPYAQVRVVGGNSTYTNANGEFTIVHPGTSGVTVESSLSGQYFEVHDQAAGDTVPSLSAGVTPPGPLEFLHNPLANEQLATANVNAYLEANVIRDFVLSYEPNFPVIAGQNGFRINTNIADVCNAFYDGVSINFYQAGSGCSNSSYTAVVYHEYGHHLIEVTGNGQGQMGEGTGDVMAVLILDEPSLGLGFLGDCSSGIRSAVNTLQYPQAGEIHYSGQLLSGCVWDTRNELLTSEPAAYRDLSASLFLGMLVVRGQVQPFNDIIDPLITVLYLELDDDDSDLGNGTPHYDEIATGFGLHNMDAPPRNLISFEFPGGRPELVSPHGGIAFLAAAVPVTENPQPGTAVLHVDRGSGFESFPLQEVTPNLYEVEFPPSELGKVLRYYLTAQASGGGTQVHPAAAPDAFFTAISGDRETPIFVDDFEIDRGWSVATTAVDGPWQRGVPAGGGTRGDPPADADGSGQCYLTDNVAGNSDVDGGSTILTSPLWDGTLAPHRETMITYARWFSNVAGNAPEQDPFQVQVSNDGGSSWVELETVGPAGPEVQGGWIFRTFRLRDVVNPTSQMRLRFVARDNDPPSVVEAAIDAVRIRQVHENVTTPVPADAMTVVKGVLLQGGLPQTVASDNQVAQFQPTVAAVNPNFTVEFSGTLPGDQPLQLVVRLEGNASRTGVTQKIQMYNFNTDKFELVDSRAASAGTDSVTEVTISGDVLRFVEIGSGAVVGRVIFAGSRATGARWRGSIDQLEWQATD